MGYGIRSGRGCSVVASALLLGVPSLLSAQLPEPTFRSDVRLMEVNVVAVDQKNQPVKDLSKSDFRLYEDGKPREIRFFVVEKSEESAPSTEATDLASTDQTVTNTPAGMSARGGHTVILLDWLNSDLPDRAQIYHRLIQMLSALEVRDHVAIYVLERRLRVVHEFTTDDKALLDSVKKLRTNADLPPTVGSRKMFDASIGPLLPDSDTFGAVDLQLRAAVTKGAIKQIADHMAGVPGRKSMIWLATRFTFDPSLKNAGIATYAVDARGLMTTFSPKANSLNVTTIPNVPAIRDAAESLARRMEQEEHNARRTVQEAAAESGGQAFFDRNDLDAIMRTALDDSRHTYTIGYYPSVPERPGTHQIRVQVARRGVTLRYRQSYSVSSPEAAPPESRAAAIVEALKQPVNATGIAISVTVSRSGRALKLEARLAPSTIAFENRENQWHGRFEVVLHFFAADGSPVGDGFSQTIALNLTESQYQKVAREGTPFTLNLVVPQNAAGLRVLARDEASGLIGTVSIPLNDSSTN